MQPHRIHVTAAIKGDIPKAVLDSLSKDLLIELRASLDDVEYTAEAFSPVVVLAINLVKTHKSSKNLCLKDQQDIAVSLILSVIIPMILEDDWVPIKREHIRTLVYSCWQAPSESAEKQVNEVVRRYREGCCIIL